MKFHEAFAMTGREFIRQVANQMMAVEAIDTWDDARKAKEVRKLLVQAAWLWQSHGMTLTEHLLNDNRNSLLDFSPEIRNGIARPPEPSIEPKVERKIA